MILSEYIAFFDIAKKLKNDFSKVLHDSVIRCIKRFFNNNLFNPYDFYDDIIKHVIANYKSKHSDKRVHITFDHMFSHDNYTVFMMSTRVGKQGISLWYRSFKGLGEGDALLKDGISHISSLFNNSFDLIFLADRWFNSTSLLEHINSLGHTYCIRFRGKTSLQIFDKKEKHHIWKNLNDITIFQKYSVAESWIIITNGDSKRASKDYAYHFGSIETIFKSQKSNANTIESTIKASIKYNSCMYTLASFAHLFLSILGAGFSKNHKCYKILFCILKGKSYAFGC